MNRITCTQCGKRRKEAKHLKVTVTASLTPKVDAKVYLLDFDQHTLHIKLCKECSENEELKLYSSTEYVLTMEARKPRLTIFYHNKHIKPKDRYKVKRDEMRAGKVSL